MKKSVSLLLGVCALLLQERYLLAFQGICNNDIKSGNKFSLGHTRVRTNSPQKRSATRRQLLLFQSFPGQDQFGHCDVDGLRRRQLLLSMLYGSATLLKAPANADGDVNVPEKPDDPFGTQAIAGTNMKILKPPKDDREYATFTLDNGLKVLLCSDPAFNEAAAAMDVHVGACSDPETIPGMAHFAEHMSFLGSKPYPKEDAFSTFLSANGGINNAYTDSEDTVYFFEMQAEEGNRLAEGLSIFGSLFASPLFTASATNRELNAIDSENAKNLQSDSFRTYQIMKERANSDHPFSKFFTGNKKTLLDDTKMQSINLRDELIKFHNKYYSANQMTLALVAPQSVEDLRDMVIKSFSTIPNKKIAKPEERWKGLIPPYNGNSVIPSLQNIVEVVPVQDLRQINLAWPIIYRSDKDRMDALLEKQSNYVAHLIGHEGPGSLLSYLKRKRWANALASSTQAELTDFETFEVTIGLTTAGLENFDKVMEAVFSYLRMLRNRAIPDYVLQEVLQLNELEWRFLTKGSPGNYVQSLATAMQKYPPSLYVAGPRRLALSEPSSKLLNSSEPRTSFSSRAQLEATKELINDYISKLTVENLMVTILSKSFGGKTDKKEEWYGTDYSVRPVPPELLSRWRNPASPNALKLDYPRPNRFIPSEAGLAVKTVTKEKPLKRDLETRLTPIPPPVVVRDDGSGGRWTVYFKEDDRFGQPKAFVIFQLLTSEVFSSAKNAALSNLYEVCVSDRLGEYAYDASLAGLTYDVKVLPRGVRLTFGGFNDKLQKFAVYVAEKISRNVKDILPRNDIEFERYKDQVLRALSAFRVKQPYAHASYYANLNLQPRRFQYTNQQLIDETTQATMQDLTSYATAVWSSGKGQALVQGNFDEPEALYLVRTIDKALGFKPISDDQVPAQLDPLPLPTPTDVPKDSNMPSLVRRTRLVVAEPNPVNGNSASFITIQSLGEGAKDHVMIELLSSIIEQPFYDDLRTRQQLGYIVSSGVKALGKTRTISFIVQSSVAPVEKLTRETLKFMDSIHDRLEKLPKVDFGTYVKGLVDRKTESDKQLAAEVMRNWGEIASGRLEFDRIQKETVALLDLEKSDVVDFWDRIYVGSQSRVLIAQVVPREGPASSPEPPRSTGYASMINKKPEGGLVLGIDDIDDFRRDLEQGRIA